MEFESPDVEKDFPGLYASESSSWRSDSDYGDSGNGKHSRKDLLKNKKKDKSKDRGYAALGEDSSAEEMEGSPFKGKKPKSFKFLHKKEEEKKKEKKRERDQKEEEKKKEKEDKKKYKEEKEKKKEERKWSKKEKKKKKSDMYEELTPVFGVPLSIAVEHCPSHDGIKLPAIVRECIDAIEEKGLNCEGIYRLSGVKSKIQGLRAAYNRGEHVCLRDEEPHVVASLLKQFLRELPEPVLTTDMMPHFEDVTLIPGLSERAKATKQLIERLPTPNHLLVQYVFKHMGNIIAREKDTKMNFQNVCIVLSPTMLISHRILNILFLNHEYLFGDVTLKKYIPPLPDYLSNRTIDQLKTALEIEEEIFKQESLLGSLHSLMAAGKISRKNEDRMWEAQRTVTLLKRRLKIAQKKYDDGKATASIVKTDELQREISSEESQHKESLKCDCDSITTESKSGSDLEIASSPKAEKIKNNVTVVDVEMHDTDKYEYDTNSADNKASPVALGDESVKEDMPETEGFKNESSASQSHVTVICIGESISDARKEKGSDKPNTFSEKPLYSIKTLHSVTGLQNSNKPTDEEISCIESDEHSEYQSLLEMEALVTAEHEVLWTMNNDLAQKLQAERAEVTRLKADIQELQTLYGYRTYSYDSSESDISESDRESDTEEELMKQLSEYQKLNCKLQDDNLNLTRKIQEERESVVQLRVRLLQAQMKSQFLPQVESIPV